VEIVMGILPALGPIIGVFVGFFLAQTTASKARVREKAGQKLILSYILVSDSDRLSGTAQTLYERDFELIINSWDTCLKSLGALNDEPQLIQAIISYQSALRDCKEVYAQNDSQFMQSKLNEVMIKNTAVISLL